MKVEVVILKNEVFDYAIAKGEVGVLLELVGDDISREMKAGNRIGAVEIGGVDVLHWKITDLPAEATKPR
jgi:hypothetical protein